MTGPQSNRRFVTPPRALIPWISRATVWAYRRTGGRIGGSGAGMKQLLLTTVGRRSGRVHTVCLPYWTDPDGNRVVVASFAGGPHHPAWYHNLADRRANPTVTVQVGSRRVGARAEILEGADREAVWEALTADRPFYRDYQARTERVIPLVRLVEISESAPDPDPAGGSPT